MDFNQLNEFIAEKNDPIAAKVGSQIASLYEEYTSSEVSTFSTLETSQPRNSMLRMDDGAVAMDFIATGDADTLLADLEKLGLKQGSVYGRYVSGMLPIEAIAPVADLKSLQFARAAMATTNVGLVTSQGDISMRADVARSTFGVDGTGVTVGALSDSYDNLGGAAGDVATGDLPGIGNPLGNTTPVKVLEDLPGGGTDEIRGMLQLVHDVAPGADLAFHTAFGGQANFANGIIELAEAGSKVIVDDVIYFAEPMFQDGIIAQAVDQVVADGAAYFSAAGNGARNSYESAFNPSGVVIPQIGEFHDFDPGVGVDFLQSITIPVGTTFIISFQWDSPFFSVSGGAGSPNDLNILLLNESGTNILAGSASNNIGNDPVEIFGFVNDGSFGTDQFNLAISNFAGPNPDLLKYVLFGNATINEYATNSSTTYGHSNAAGAEAVGAAFYQQTPEFGVNPPELEFFSSAGGTPILFDIDGNRLPEPEIRLKPGIVAPDGTNTTFFPPFPGQDVEGDGFPNFFGTSAAAPHAAAVAALMLDAVPGATPAQIYEALEQTALDMDDPFTPGFDVGFDFRTGFGFIQADAAIAELIGSTDGNGGFETGDFTAWRTIGDASIQTAEFGAIPTQGDFQALLTTSFSPVSDNTLESFLGLNPGDIDNIGNGDAIEGSALRKTITVEAGDVLSFDFNFLTDEETPTFFNDFAFVSITSNTLSELADTNSFFELSPTQFFEETDYDNFTFEFSEAGTYTVGIGVVDLIDTVVDSGLLVDDFKIVSASEAILGTDESESLFGTVGDDSIFGKGGNDQIFGSEGMNTLYGGAGDDTMYGGSQADTIYGGLGNDLIFAAEGENIVFGGAGDDTIYTGSGNDKIIGGFGNDIIWLGGGQDIVVLEAGKGIDTINNFQLGQTTFDISGNTSELSIVDGANGAEISLFGELLAVVSWQSASTFIDNINTVFA